VSPAVSGRTTLEGLHASTPEALPFAPEIDVRAFLLEREDGNVLVYSVSGLATDAAEIELLGGISRQYLNHWHEAMFTSDWYEGPLFVHAADRVEVEERRHVRGSFTRRHMLHEDFEVIPTPGHTPGATAYLWDSGRQRFLFTGDTIYLSDGEWVDGLLESSDLASYLESLKVIRELEFDVLVPWAARGEHWYSETTPELTRERIDALLERLG
jgi:glyoxylase-like metal-dependent hydrolase (beta-lactamase superfamily II)